MSEKRIVLVEYDYVQGDCGHYSSQVLMTPEQQAETERVLYKAQSDGDEITNIYVGPAGDPIPFAEFEQDCAFMVADREERKGKADGEKRS
jgi:hypothetical protein